MASTLLLHAGEIMLGSLPTLYLARHGDTDWTLSGQHTGRTDLALNAIGEEHGRQLGAEIQHLHFAAVFCSPLQRALRTCSLAGFEERATIDPDLVEWDYGRFEGKRTCEIQKEWPGWQLFHDGCPGGESPEDVAARALNFISRVRNIDGDVLAFSSGHIIRMITTCWLGLPPDIGRFFYCPPASIGLLGFAHGNRNEPVIQAWNCAAQHRELSVAAPGDGDDS